MTKQQGAATQILAVSPDGHDDSKKLAQRLKNVAKDGVVFPLLADGDQKVIGRYGILNPESRGWPHPTTYVIDKQGIVRWKFTEVDYTKRPTNKQILAELRKLK